MNSPAPAAPTSNIEDDATNPLGVYGATKLSGEQAIQTVGGDHLIFRTTWVYGTRGKNFLLTILRLAAEKPLPIAGKLTNNV
jgi:dTDP-4-dehydrorhamnose reductase